MTFLAWLRQHQRAQSAIGDLARDALRDPERPRTLRHKQEWYMYLLTQNACDAALDTFQRAWEAYGQDTGTHITNRLQALDTPSFQRGYPVRSTEEGCAGCGDPWAALEYWHPKSLYYCEHCDIFTRQHGLPLCQRCRYRETPAPHATPKKI